jgi:hypothetical protein
MMHRLLISIWPEEKDTQAFLNPAMGRASDLRCGFRTDESHRTIREGLSQREENAEL